MSTQQPECQLWSVWGNKEQGNHILVIINNIINNNIVNSKPTII
jgi:hypothetical protein